MILIQDLAGFPGPPGFWGNSWVTVDAGPVTDGDVSCWPLSVSSLVKFPAFLGTICWPEGLNDMGKCGVSFEEILILFERWVGHRLLTETTVRENRRAGRAISAGCTPIF